MSAISGDWLEALKGEFHQPYYAKLYKTVMIEYQTRKIFPPADDLFNAFHFTPLNEVKVVILGQDLKKLLIHIRNIRMNVRDRYFLLISMRIDKRRINSYE